MRRVVDDEVDAGEMLERADVATLAADDPPLHVVGGELDDADGRLGRVARRDALEGIGDERPRPPLRVGARLLLELAHGARELVADQVLRALEELLARLAEREPADALELAEHRVVAGLELLLELLRVRSRGRRPPARAGRAPRASPSSSVSRWCTRSSIFAIWRRLAWISVSISARRATASSRLSIWASRRVVSASRSASARIARRWSSASRSRDVLAVRSHAQRPSAPTAIPSSAATTVSMDAPFRGMGPAAWAAVAHIRTPPARRPPGKTGRAAFAISVGVPSAEQRSCRRSVGSGWSGFIGEPVFGMRSVQVKCRMKHPYPNASATRFAMIDSSAASENPRDAR